MTAQDTVEFENDLSGLREREAFEAHGPSSYLINRLAYYGLLGWILFILLLVTDIVVGTVFYLKPPLILTQDESGRIVGRVELLGPQVRTEAEILGAGKRFTEAFLSNNSDTVLEDKYLALSMMDEPLRKKWYKIWYDLNVVNEIAQQKVHCIVLIDDHKTSLKQTAGLTYYMSTAGDVRCGEKNSPSLHFLIDFTLQATPRTWTQTSGVKIVNLFNNPFDSAHDNTPS